MKLSGNPIGSHSNLVILDALVVQLLVKNIDLLGLVYAFLFSTYDPVTLVHDLIFKNDEALLESLHVNTLLVRNFFLLYKLFFKSHLLVYNLFLDRGLDAF